MDGFLGFGLLPRNEQYTLDYGRLRYTDTRFLAHRGKIKPSGLVMAGSWHLTLHPLSYTI